MISEKNNLFHPSNWKYRSSDSAGLSSIITPENSACKITSVFRLNLVEGASYYLQNKHLELNGVVISGQAEVRFDDQNKTLDKLDSFYLPGNENLEIKAKKDLFMLIGGAPYEGIGDYFTRKFDLSLPEGDIHQIHGEPPYQREVFITVNQEVPASKLICGITWGEPGKWTSWPPHQHSKDLEEIYCYFDIPAPEFSLHLSSRKPEVIEAVHPVSTGDCVAVPQGYHPTVGIPGVSSKYFWVMAAHSQESRRYDLAVEDYGI